MSKKVMVFVGTSKGGFIFNSNATRKKWQMSDIQFKSWNMMHMQMDPRNQRLHAAISHFVYGQPPIIRMTLAKRGHRQNKSLPSRAHQSPADQQARWMKPSVPRAEKI
jgi:hypothetical protein